MKIEVLGRGCPKKALYENVVKTLKSAGKEIDVTKIEDVARITNGKGLSGEGITKLNLFEKNDAWKGLFMKNEG